MFTIVFSYKNNFYRKRHPWVQEKNRSGPNVIRDANRLINIEGREDADILKAVFYIFCRVAEVRNVIFSLVQLHIEFQIPDRIVGSLIGKGGSYVS